MMLDELKTELRTYVNPEKAVFFPRFFKSGPGQYGEGDKFLGVTVPNQRLIAKKFQSLPLKDIELLLSSPWHEERLTALFIMVMQFKSSAGSEPLNQKKQQEIYKFYLKHRAHINNWDLVDSSARDIVGGYLYRHQRSCQS